MTASQPGARRVELEQRLLDLQQRIARAAAEAGRQPSEITLIAITKTWPASDIAALAALGVTDIGENRAQELESKLEQLERTLPDLRWHFVGQLQRNKAGLVARHCAAVHTVDRAVLVAALSRAAQQAGRQLEIFVQLSLDGDPARGGVIEEGVGPLADEVAASADLRLAGLMAMPPLGAAARPAFARLREASERLRCTHPGAVALSAGMSADLEDAVIEGATHLRVGTGLMGSRA